MSKNIKAINKGFVKFTPFSKRWQIATFYIAVIFGTVFLSTALVFKAKLKCLLIDHTEYERIAESVYVHPNMDDWDRAMLLRTVIGSRERLAHFFGSVTSQPVIIAGHVPEVMEDFGADRSAPGMNYLTPFGSFVIIGPKGLNLDVVSHELAHAELGQRLGWWKKRQQVPAWFDEGLALMLDHRYRGTERMWHTLTNSGKKAPSLTELSNMSDFNRFSQISPIISYVTAKKEVARWWEHVGLKGLEQLITDLKQGQDFLVSYQRIEKEALQNKED